MISIANSSNRESSLYPKRTIPIFMIMSATSYVTRRATVEDLPQLLALWRLERLPADALEKRFTEFQVVSDNSGEVLGAVGIQIAGSHGLLHGESMARPEHADEFRQ